MPNTPAFNLNLPGLYPQAPVQPQYPALPAYPPVPGQQPQYPYNPAAPGQPAALTPDMMSLSQLANPVGAGGMAGYKAPRGLEQVRTRLAINKFGQRVYRGANSYGGGRSYSRGYGGGGYGNNYGGGYGSRSYGSRSYGSRYNSRYSQSGYSAPFGVWAAVKSSVIWGGIISLAINGYQYMNKQETGATAGANVAGDLVSSAVGGAAGALASWAGAGALAAMGLTGFALSAGGILIGIGGFMAADYVLRQTDIFKSLQRGAYQLFGGV